jgi:inner membrane protein
MDNLTHSLVGALIGQMGLKRKTGLAMPTLIIAANIPDIDAVATLLGGHQHLAIRRGITHGPIAMVVLPLLLWGIMLWFDRWQTKRETRPEKRLPVDAKWLLALAYIGCLSHPLFDWFNSYGIRLLEPFSSQWFYGDTLFIIDVWIWIAMGLGLGLSLKFERTGRSYWMRTARISSIIVGVYLLTNFLITIAAESKTHQALFMKRMASNPIVVANPVPIQFWRREMLWRTDKLHGWAYYSAIDGVTSLKGGRSHGASRQALDEVSADSDARAFLFWSRMPRLLRIEGSKGAIFLQITDQRFDSTLVGDRFSVEVPIEK